MLGRCARLRLHVHAPLEGNLIVGTHPCKAWQGRIHGLKINEVERILQFAQLFSDFWAVPRLSHLHASTRTAEPRRERIALRNFANRLNAESNQLCDGACVNSGEAQNVIVRKRGIAVVKELASDWVAALRTSSDSGRVTHSEDTKL